jgi:hypothetical protein
MPPGAGKARGGSSKHGKPASVPERCDNGSADGGTEVPANLYQMSCKVEELAPYVEGVRVLLYCSQGLVDANLPSMSALRERLRLMARQPLGMSGVHILVFDAETDRYLGRRDIVVDEGELVLVSPAVGP